MLLLIRPYVATFKLKQASIQIREPGSSVASLAEKSKRKQINKKTKLTWVFSGKDA